ncbi:MAG: T9SS type A sorting domain-containing protein [Bacteroidetes bacterium]|nr:T9SS type A sorting domain-containing protein [Bacteroidota bacterium]
MKISNVFKYFQIPPVLFVVEQTDISAIDANELNVSIYNTVGVLVLQEKTEEGSRIDISNLPNGIYTVVINQFNEYQESKTIVVVK